MNWILLFLSCPVPKLFIHPGGSTQESKYAQSPSTSDTSTAPATVQATTISSQHCHSSPLTFVPFEAIFNPAPWVIPWQPKADHIMLCSKPDSSSIFYPWSKPKLLLRAFCDPAVVPFPTSFLPALLLAFSIWPQWLPCCPTSVPQGLFTGSFCSALISA